MSRKETQVVSGDELFRIFRSSDAESIVVVKHVRNECIGQTVARYPAIGKERYSIKAVKELVKSWVNVQ